MNWFKFSIILHVMQKSFSLFLIMLFFACACSDDPRKSSTEKFPGENYILPKKIVMRVFTADFCECTDIITIDFTYESDRLKSIDRLVKYDAPNYPAFKDSVFEHFEFEYHDKELHVNVTDENNQKVSHGVFFFSGSEYVYPTSFNYTSYSGGVPVSETISFSYAADNFLQTVTKGNETDTFYVKDDNLFYTNNALNAKLDYSELPAHINQFSGFNWFYYTDSHGREVSYHPNPIMYPLKLFRASKNLSNTDVNPYWFGRSSYQYEMAGDTIKQITFIFEDVDYTKTDITIDY